MPSRARAGARRLVAPTALRAAPTARRSEIAPAAERGADSGDGRVADQHRRGVGRVGDHGLGVEHRQVAGTLGVAMDQPAAGHLDPAGGRELGPRRVGLGERAR